MNSNQIIPPHGGYRQLKSYQQVEIVYDGTVAFCDRFVPRQSCTHDVMVQTARNGKQYIMDGYTVSGTSGKIELRLVGIARANLEELLLDYQAFLRQRDLPRWEKDHPGWRSIRRLAYEENRSYKTYWTYIERRHPEVAANTMVCLIQQANYLLDRRLCQLERRFLREGGFTERLFRVRKRARSHG